MSKPGMYQEGPRDLLLLQWRPLRWQMEEGQARRERNILLHKRRQVKLSFSLTVFSSSFNVTLFTGMKVFLTLESSMGKASSSMVLWINTKETSSTAGGE